MLYKRLAVIAMLVGALTGIANAQRWEPRSYQVDRPHLTRHTGQLMLGVRTDGPRTLGGTDGDYVPFQFGEHGGLYASVDQVHIDIDELQSLTPAWTASTDAKALILSATSEHVASHEGFTSVSLEKDGGTVVEASYGKTITSLDGSAMPGAGLVDFYVKHADFTNVGEVFVRLGTGASDYNQYGIDPDELSTSLWNHLSFSLHEGVQTGTGLDLSNITYVAFGVIMDAAGNTVAAVLFNDLELHSVNASELVITGNAANTVRVSKFGSPSNATATTGAGNTSTGTLRVTIATDDINLAAIKTAVESDVLVSQTLIRQTFRGSPADGVDL